MTGRHASQNNEIDIFLQLPARDLSDVKVMREEDGLSRLAEIGEEFDRAGDALFVETREQIVAYKWQWLSRAQFEKREAQSKEKLVAGAFAHMVDADISAICTPALDHRPVRIVIIDDKTSECTGGRNRK